MVYLQPLFILFWINQVFQGRVMYPMWIRIIPVSLVQKCMANVRVVDGRSKKRRLDRSPLLGDTRWLRTLFNFSFRVCDRGNQGIHSEYAIRSSEYDTQSHLDLRGDRLVWNTTGYGVYCIEGSGSDICCFSFDFDQNHMDVAMFFPGSQLLQDRWVKQSSYFRLVDLSQAFPRTPRSSSWWSRWSLPTTNEHRRSNDFSGTRTPG